MTSLLDVFQIDTSDDKRITVIACHGCKIRCRGYDLDSIIKNKAITDTYTLSVKRLNRWWYSIYFYDKSKNKDDKF